MARRKGVGNVPAKNMEVIPKKPRKGRMKKEKPKLKIPSVVKVKIRKTTRQPVSSTPWSAEPSSTEMAALRKIELANEVALAALSKPTRSFGSELVKTKPVAETNEADIDASVIKVGSEVNSEVKAKVGKKRARPKKLTVGDNTSDITEGASEIALPPPKKTLKANRAKLVKKVTGHEEFLNGASEIALPPPKKTLKTNHAKLVKKVTEQEELLNGASDIALPPPKKTLKTNRAKFVKKVTRAKLVKKVTEHEEFLNGASEIALPPPKKTIKTNRAKLVKKVTEHEEFLNGTSEIALPPPKKKIKTNRAKLVEKVTENEEFLNEITEIVAPPQVKFKDKPVKSKKNVIPNNMLTTKKQVNMLGPECKTEKLIGKSQCKCDTGIKIKYSKKGKNAGLDNTAASEHQNSPVLEYTSLKDKNNDSSMSQNIESRKITSVPGYLSWTEDISSSTTTTCLSVPSIDIVKKNKKEPVPLLADRELIPSAHLEDQPPGKDSFETTPAYSTQTEPELGDSSQSSSSSSSSLIESSSLKSLDLSTSSSTKSIIYNCNNIKDYSEKLKLVLEKFCLESNSSSNENANPKIKKFVDIGWQIINAEKHILQFCESLLELLYDEPTESPSDNDRPVENANKDIEKGSEKADSCPGNVRQQQSDKSEQNFFTANSSVMFENSRDAWLQQANKIVSSGHSSVTDSSPGDVRQQQPDKSEESNRSVKFDQNFKNSEDALLQKANKIVSSGHSSVTDSFPGNVRQQQPDKSEENFVTADDQNCENSGYASLQKANKIVSSGLSSVETFTTDQVKYTSFEEFSNDDDALTIYAESLSGIGSTRLDSFFPCASEADFEKNDSQRVTNNPSIIDSANAVSEKQNANSTSTHKVQEPSSNISSNCPVPNEGVTFLKEIPSTSSKINTQQKRLMAEQYTFLSVVKSFIFRGVCFFNLISNCKKARCTFAHVELDIAEIKNRLEKLSDRNFIQEYMITRRFRILRETYGDLFVKECQRRDLTRVLVEMSMDFIMKAKVNSAENRNQKIFVTEQALLHLNNVDLSVCDDLLLYVVDKNKLLCEVYMETLAETLNFSIFKQIFTKLAEFIVKHDKILDLIVVKHILAQICSLPYEEQIAKTLILLMKNTNDDIFDMMMPFEQLLLSNGAQELYSDVFACRSNMLKSKYTKIYKRLSGNVNQEKDMSVVQTDRSTSPDTTKLGNLINPWRTRPWINPF